MEILPRIKIQYPMKNRYKYKFLTVFREFFSMNVSLEPGYKLV
jgi:hypothetical protein